MSVLTSNLSRRTLLLSGASVAALAATGATLGAPVESSPQGRRFAVSINASGGEQVSRRIFGGDLEAFAHVIYGGVWDPERNIPRMDVKAAIGALGTTAIRWPGSSSASAYHWRDGVGPQSKRPLYEHTFWTDYGGAIADSLHVSAAEKAKIVRGIAPSESNQFGTDEFLQYCLDLGTDPVLSVNVGGSKSRGDGTPQEAAAWVRYCNVERKAPRSVRWWQLGNEVWSKLDRDHQPPKDYGLRVVELAAAMRREDPSIKIICVATGVHPADFNPDTGAAFPDLDIWNREVFSVAAPHVNAASFTWYFPGSLGRVLRANEADALQMATASDVFGASLDRVIADLDAVGVAGTQVPLYLGEWGRQVKFPEILFDDTQKLYDGLFFAGCFNRMIERSKRVVGAHMSMLVNTIGPIQTSGDRHFVTVSYLVSQLYRWSCRREHAPVTVKSDSVLVPAFEDAQQGTYIVEMARTDRRAAILDATATVDEFGTTLYLVNRNITQPITVELAGVTPIDTHAVFRYVTADSPYSSNTLEAPDTIRIAEIPVVVKGGRAEVTIPPCTAGALIAGPLAGALVAS